MGEATPHLLARQRQAVIREWLQRDGRVVAAELSANFGVSDDTVRRDLRELAASGECRRVYGGALPFAPDGGSFKNRQDQDKSRKLLLGRAIASTFEPGSTIFIDAGSTNLAVAEALPSGLGLTIVTNTPAIACTLAERSGTTVVMLGGRFDGRSGACLGAQTLREAERIRPSVLVLGACGIDAEAGITTHDLEEADLKASLASRAETIAVAATNDKIGTAASFVVAALDRRLRLFVEPDCDAAALTPFEAQGLRVLRAEEAASETSIARRRTGAPVSQGALR
ncbi:DeoR/GlpR family DNA-binding transcription regulator [Aureimonas sp. ME7]|uniref:DeoR/GlpR family DNA-binding transcription regulator n=1 Tax=Aureimonas sp. ME7 TaxID=2744252 RepID=UPI0015F50F2D|nr:DeoR/GlpR family DNA-binding transcription regulator [Aureimonas sp. ME7]